MVERVSHISRTTSSFWLRYIRAMLSDPVLTDHVRNFTIPPPTSIDSTSVLSAYNDVRSDSTETKWLVLKYEGNNITLAATGESFDGFKTEFGESERCYGYMRIQTGDEMSKRTKFILLTWVGPKVGVMNRARVTGDKCLVKQILKNYATELQLENLADLDEELFRAELFKVGGTCYGTGVSNEHLIYNKIE